MLKLEKLFFWTTLASFAVPLSLELNSGYRVHCFELPLWGLYILWGFRFGLRLERLRLIKFDFYFFVFMMWLAMSLSVANAWDIGANNWLLWIKCYLVGLYLRHNLYRLYPLSSVVTFLLVLLFLEVSLGVFQGITQSTVGAIQQYFGQRVDHISSFDAGVLWVVRVQGTFMHTNILGNWIVMLLPLAVVKALTSTGRARILYWLGSGVALVALALTLSRGNWGALAFGLIVMSYVSGILDFKRINPGRLILGVSIVGVYLASIIFTYSEEIDLFSEVISQRITILPGSNSGSIRYTLTLAAMQLIEENPLWGVGLGKSNELLHYTNYEIMRSFKATVHNIFLIIACEAGLVALVLFVVVLWQPFKHIYKIARKKRHQIGEEERVVSTSLLGGYSGLFFAMFWYTGMLDNSELPLIVAFMNFALGLRAVKKPIASAETVETVSIPGGVAASPRLVTANNYTMAQSMIVSTGVM
ncbi:O-antigen ligase family protein [candidate division KSB1 bacterium]|nr:O-antigen ligase family protein [candidate division KSB1 bacterium]